MISEWQVNTVGTIAIRNEAAIPFDARDGKLLSKRGDWSRQMDVVNVDREGRMGCTGIDVLVPMYAMSICKRLRRKFVSNYEVSMKGHWYIHVTSGYARRPRGVIRRSGTRLVTIGVPSRDDEQKSRFIHFSCQAC